MRTIPREKKPQFGVTYKELADKQEELINKLSAQLVKRDKTISGLKELAVQVSQLAIDMCVLDHTLARQLRGIAVRINNL